MNFKDRLIFKIALALILVISLSIATFSAAKFINIILRDAVFKAQNCYINRPMSIDDKNEGYEQKCEQDTNQTKRDFADSLSILIISGPISFLAYRQLKKLENKK